MTRRSNKGGEFILIVSAAVILSCIYLGFQLFVTNVAYSHSTTLMTGINTAIFSSDPNIIVFGQYRNLYRAPNQTMNFITKGIRREIREEEGIYTISTLNHSPPQLLTTITPPKEEHLNYNNFEIVALEKNYLYLKVRYLSSDQILGERTYYSFDTATNQLHQFSEEEAVNFDNLYYGQNRFETRNPNLWVGYKKEIGIIEATGRFLLDQKNRQIFKSGSEANVVKVLLEQQVLDSYLPKADQVITMDEP